MPQYLLHKCKSRCVDRSPRIRNRVSVTNILLSEYNPGWNSGAGPPQAKFSTTKHSRSEDSKHPRKRDPMKPAPRINKNAHVQTFSLKEPAYPVEAGIAASAASRLFSCCKFEGRRSPLVDPVNVSRATEYVSKSCRTQCSQSWCASTYSRPALIKPFLT
jgi:hypothetical protein